MPEETTKEPTLERVLGKDNLRAAWLAVKANGGAPGVDGMENIGEVWTRHPLESRGGRQLTAAGFNRRMRKTARPVVWKGHGAKSP